MLNLPQRPRPLKRPPRRLRKKRLSLPLRQLWRLPLLKAKPLKLRLKKRLLRSGSRAVALSKTVVRKLSSAVVARVATNRASRHSKAKARPQVKAVVTSSAARAVTRVALKGLRVKAIEIRVIGRVMGMAKAVLSAVARAVIAPLPPVSAL